VLRNLSMIVLQKIVLALSFKTVTIIVDTNVLL